MDLIGRATLTCRILRDRSLVRRVHGYCVMDTIRDFVCLSRIDVMLFCCYSRAEDIGNMILIVQNGA